MDANKQPDYCCAKSRRTLRETTGALLFGLVTTRDMENLYMLAQYIEEELQNLEAAVFDSI